MMTNDGRGQLGPIRDLAVYWLPLTTLKANPKNARTHSKRQLTALAQCIREVGFTNPVIIDEDGMILAGHARVGAATMLGFDTIPVIRIDALSEAQRRAYVLADNKLAERAGWDRDMLAVELGELSVLLPNLDLSLDLTGFEAGEIDVILSDHDEAAQPKGEDAAGPGSETPVSRAGDIWRLGRHRILCADARDPASLSALLGDEQADLVFTDPPYTVPSEGDVVGHRCIERGEFAMARGGPSGAEFHDCLAEVLGRAVTVTRAGSLHYVAVDWRHVADLIDMGKGIYSGLADICVWTKSSHGHGSLYRSQHLLFAVFEVGPRALPTTGEIGRVGCAGRGRSNVWTHAAADAIRAGRGEPAIHTTVKPVALVADAIKDVTSRHAIVLDPFGGRGTTLIAAERTGRRARLLEIEPRHVDVTIRRFESLTKVDAVHARTGLTFAEEAGLRGGPVH
ncbi:site-specific DNA-methyltransferase [Rhodoplanes roseus]|uniref:Methyltransferase n=1 Tax=Rhodoplanes roseus TaxID=29409 RepID=A0A327L0J8_9BRAD|nr:DNA methyltransferase [Rhodoplanes roseus]RAI43794.1 hypothetical protein CH341_12455 [Rhodoplanes roseus]